MTGRAGGGVLPLPLIERIQRSELGYEIGKVDELDGLWRGISSQEGSKDRDRDGYDCDGGLGGTVDLQVYCRSCFALSIGSRLGQEKEQKKLTTSIRDVTEGGDFQERHDARTAVRELVRCCRRSTDGGVVRRTTRPCSWLKVRRSSPSC